MWPWAQAASAGAGTSEVERRRPRASTHASRSSARYNTFAPSLMNGAPPPVTRSLAIVCFASRTRWAACSVSRSSTFNLAVRVEGNVANSRHCYILAKMPYWWGTPYPINMPPKMRKTADPKPRKTRRERTLLRDRKPVPIKTGEGGDTQQLADYKAFANRLLAYAKTHGLSQGALARIMGSSTDNVRQYLEAEHQPGYDKLRRLGEGGGDGAPGVSLDWLVLGDGGNDVVKRGDWRTRGRLSDDVAAEVARRAGGLDLGDQSIERPVLDADAILASAAEQARSDMFTWSIWGSHVRQYIETAAYRVAAELLQTAPGPLVAGAIAAHGSKDVCEYFLSPSDKDGSAQATHIPVTHIWRQTVAILGYLPGPRPARIISVPVDAPLAVVRRKALLAILAEAVDVATRRFNSPVPPGAVVRAMRFALGLAPSTLIPSARATE